MQYREYLPHPLLRSIIECYWSVQGDSSDYRTIFPDGCTDIIFNLGLPLVIRRENTIQINKESAFVVGNMTSPVQTKNEGYANLLGVRFMPAGLSHFINVPLNKINDDRVALKDVADVPASLSEALQQMEISHRIQFLDRFFLKRIPLTPAKTSCLRAELSYGRQAWQACLNRMMESGGQTNVYTLSRDIGISQKQLERKFSEKVGLTPKQFCQILRFRRLKNKLEMSPKESLLSIAWDFGFTDQAHLTKFFKSYADVTPSEFMTQVS